MSEKHWYDIKIELPEMPEPHREKRYRVEDGKRTRAVAKAMERLSHDMPLGNRLTTFHLQIRTLDAEG